MASGRASIAQTFRAAADDHQSTVECLLGLGLASVDKDTYGKGGADRGPATEPLFARG